MINYFLTEQTDRLDSQSALADIINHFLTEQTDRLDSQSALADIINHFLTEQTDRLDSQSALADMINHFPTEQGIEQGFHKKAVESAQILKQLHCDTAMIIQVTGLSKEEIEAIG